MKKILIIAVHPDDEVLGAGGTLLKAKAAGDNITVCFCTKGSEKDYSKQVLEAKKVEAEQASKMLGCEKPHFLDFVAGEVNTLPASQINKALIKVVEEVQPDIMFIPHKGDLHTDHQAIFNTCLVAARPGNKFKVKKVLAYETNSETEWSSPYENIFVPNIYVDVTETIKGAQAVLKVYKSELREYPHPRSSKALEIKAGARGIEIAVEAAEAFMLIREIE